MKKILPILLLFFSSNNILAQEIETIAVFRFNSTVDYFLLDNHPSITFENENLVISTSNLSYNVVIPISDVSDCKFVVTTKIGNVSKNECKIFIDNNGVTIKQAKPGCLVNIYNTAGVSLYSASTNSNGEVFINANKLDRGVSIFKINNQEYKIIRK